MIYAKRRGCRCTTATPGVRKELDHINVKEWFDPAHPHSNPVLAE